MKPLSNEANADQRPEQPPLCQEVAMWLSSNPPSSAGLFEHVAAQQRCRKNVTSEPDPLMSDNMSNSYKITIQEVGIGTYSLHGS